MYQLVLDYVKDRLMESFFCVLLYAYTGFQKTYKSQCQYLHMLEWE